MAAFVISFYETTQSSMAEKKERVFKVVALAIEHRSHLVEQFLGPRQAAHMGGQDAIGAALHALTIPPKGDITILYCSWLSR